MSLPRPREGEPSNLLQPQLEVEVSSSSWGTNTNTNTTHNHSNNNNNNNNSNSNSNSLSPRSLVSHKKSKVEESDEDLFTVPDVEAQPPITNIDNPEIQNQAGFSGKRRRGRNPVDKEYRRLKRLLRNRVSAQQARERKKVYVNDLESRANELQDRNSKLEEKISTLIKENTMLRKVLMNTRPKVDESVEPNQDQLSKS